MLIGFRRTVVVAAALAVIVSLASARGDDSRVALEIVNRTDPGETGTLTIALTGTALATAPTPLYQVYLRLSYDSERLDLTTIGLASPLADRYDLLFFVLPIDSLWPGHSALWFGLRTKPSAEPAELADTALDLVSITFDRLDPERQVPDPVDLTFCWLELNDNTFRSGKTDTVLASNRVFDPDTVEITCPDSMLPNRCGLPDSMLERLNAEYAPSVRGLDFRALRVRFDLPTAVEGEDGGETPTASPVLYPNYPNPFNLSTRIRFAMPRSGRYRVTIVNSLGRVVRSFEGTASAGQVSLIWDGTDSGHRTVAAGIYLCRLETAEGSATRKMVLLK